MSPLAFLKENNISGQGNSPKNDVGAASGVGRHSSPREDDVGDLNKRIEAMHKRDVLMAWAFVVGLWCAMIFVAIATWDLAPSGGARILLLIGGAIVLVLNTAAILAMLRHYREDRDFMYGLDIKFSDEARGHKG
jgi:hypothetical protein